MPQTADPARIAEMVRAGCELRTGRKLGRTLYLKAPYGGPDMDLCVGIADSTELAGEIARRWNLVERGGEQER